ncbi:MULTISPECIES: DUF3099 domain-containing protein [Actinomadura]|uniref:DUF3099 domain-containing protein n=1 Tax=Actinomadura rayongensis TaxID=1429076 RepID=A0A6I4WDF5_9ACTN|nr:DUF3099 domain-containing protein [Actinomadura rubteroloni]MXQ67691.1 DUF3099 domain-containing protein [Actinomadura rayongensis]
MKVNPRRSEDVHLVTDARRPLSEDISARQKRYLLSMGLRTSCFLGAVFAGLAHAPFWAVGVLVLGAIFLPYVAVVVANAGRRPDPPARLRDGQSRHHKRVSGSRPEIGS